MGSFSIIVQRKILGDLPMTRKVNHAQACRLRVEMNSRHLVASKYCSTYNHVFKVPYVVLGVSGTIELLEVGYPDV